MADLIIHSLPSSYSVLVPVARVGILCRSSLFGDSETDKDTNSDNAEVAFSHDLTSHPVYPGLPVMHSGCGGGVSSVQGPGICCSWWGHTRLGGGVRHQVPGWTDLPAPGEPLWNVNIGMFGKVNA